MAICDVFFNEKEVVMISLVLCYEEGCAYDPFIPRHTVWPPYTSRAGMSSILSLLDTNKFTVRQELLYHSLIQDRPQPIALPKDTY